MSSYIQENPARISIATLPIHYLLHLASSIRQSGPLWCTWAFPMECYCGSLLPAITSRKHPFRSIDRRELELEQIRQVKMCYNLTDQLNLNRGGEQQLEIVLDNCKVFLTMHTCLFIYLLHMYRSGHNHSQNPEADS